MSQRGCIFKAANLTQYRTSVGTNCDVYESNNSGCGVDINDNNSFGPSFNGIGGGWYNQLSLSAKH